MKKLIVIFLFSCIVGILNAQNFQVLNGIGSDKEYVNFVTAELYKPLEHGTFYSFTDLKINKNGYFDSYTEIFTYWNVGENGFSITGQINTGLFTTEGMGVQINPVYLFGLSHATSIGDLILTLDALYRIDKGLNLEGQEIGHGAQLTGTFLRDWDNFQISGYCDLFQTEHSECYNKNQNSLIIQFEPQAWWKFSERVYLGIEGRISNFNDPDLGLFSHSAYIMGGLKWNLEL